MYEAGHVFFTRNIAPTYIHVYTVPHVETRILTESMNNSFRPKKIEIIGSLWFGALFGIQRSPRMDQVHHQVTASLYPATTSNPGTAAASSALPPLPAPVFELHT